MEDDGRPGLCAWPGMRQLLSGWPGCDEKDWNVEVFAAGGDEGVSGDGGGGVKEEVEKEGYIFVR